MIGSSIFEFWGQPKWGQLRISNCAVRSTQSEDWLNYDLTNLPASNHILVYCGSNDLIFDKSATQIIGNVCTLLDKLAEHFPNARLGYFSIMLCPQKSQAKQLQIINDINQQIANYCHYKYDYFDFNDFIDNDDKWFVEDGLHLTEQAYTMLNEKLTPILTQWAKQNSKATKFNDN